MSRPFQETMSIRTKLAWLAGGVALVVLVVGLWEPTGDVPGASFQGALPAMSVDEAELAGELAYDVQYLAGTIGERNLRRYANLERAANWLSEELRKSSFKPRRQTYEVGGKLCHNIEVTIQGSEQVSGQVSGQGSEVIVVGAHYDSAVGSPGANDNGSGVAALLALARRMGSKTWTKNSTKDSSRPRGTGPRRSLRFVWFTNEEPPYFQTINMGSLQYAQSAKQRGDNIIAMLSLETMGYFSDKPGSQEYPAPIRAQYPDVGNFISFVGDTKSRSLMLRVLAAFRKQTRFPSEGAAFPGHMQGIGWSDHWSFWQQGYPAIMVSDTAPFRYRHYHTVKDTSDKLDYDRLARVVLGIEKVLVELVEHGTQP